MVAQPFDVVDSFLPHVGQKSIVGGVGGAAEDKILPHQDTPLIGLAVELLIFVDATSPDAHHIHVCLFDVIEHLCVVSAILLRGEDLPGDIVGSFGKKWSAVYLEEERTALRILPGNVADSAQSCSDSFFGDHLVVHHDLCGEIIHVLFSPIYRHPQLWRGYDEREIEPVFSFQERDFLILSFGVTALYAVYYRQRSFQ